MTRDLNEPLLASHHQLTLSLSLSQHKYTNTATGKVTASNFNMFSLERDGEIYRERGREIERDGERGRDGERCAYIKMYMCLLVYTYLRS